MEATSSYLDATKSVLENQFPLTYGSTLADASAMFNNLTIGGREEGSTQFMITFMTIPTPLLG